MKTMRVCATLLLLMLLTMTTACVPQVRVEEFQLFRQAFNNVQAAGQPLFDDLAVAERELGRQEAVRRSQGEESDQAETADTGDQGGLPACSEGSPGWQRTLALKDQATDPGYIDGYCLEDAVYFAEAVDPPATRAFRQGVETLGRYSEILLILAEGKNIEEAQSQLMALGGSVAGTVALIPGGQGAAATIVPVLGALGKIVEEAGRAQNFKEMTRVVVLAEPKIKGLITSLKAAAPWIFETLVRSTAAQAPTMTKNNPELAQNVVDRIEGYRRAVSGLVVLLDEMSMVHQDIMESLKRSEQAPLTLARLSNRVENLNAQARALREALVILRRGQD